MILLCLNQPALGHAFGKAFGLSCGMSEHGASNKGGQQEQARYDVGNGLLEHASTLPQVQPGGELNNG